MFNIKYLIAVFFKLMLYTVAASSVIYKVDVNARRESGAAVLREQTTTSRRHCSYLCTSDDRCVAANYDANTAQCQLLAFPLGVTTDHMGTSAAVSFPIKSK